MLSHVERQGAVFVSLFAFFDSQMTSPSGLHLNNVNDTSSVKARLSEVLALLLPCSTLTSEYNLSDIS